MAFCWSRVRQIVCSVIFYVWRKKMVLSLKNLSWKPENKLKPMHDHISDASSLHHARGRKDFSHYVQYRGGLSGQVDLLAETVADLERCTFCQTECMHDKIINLVGFSLQTLIGKSFLSVLNRPLKACHFRWFWFHSKENLLDTVLE